MSDQDPSFDNKDFIKLFMSIFETEIYLCTNGDLFKGGQSLLSKPDIQEYIISSLELEIIFPGYGKPISLITGVDDYEFLLSILNFFEINGKIFRKTEFIEKKFKEIIAISFYNVHTDSIEVITSSTEYVITSDLIHLYWLQNLKTNIYNILVDLHNKEIDSYLIRKNYKQFIKTINGNTEENTVD